MKKNDGIPTYYVNKDGDYVNNINWKVYDDETDEWNKKCWSCGWRHNSVYCPRCGSCV